MSLNNFSTKDLIGTNTAIERPLGRGIATLRPTQGRAASKKRIFLLNAEPGFVVFILVLQLNQAGSRVGLMHGPVREPHLVHDQDVVAAADGIGCIVNRTEQAVAVMPYGLHGARTVESPEGNVFKTVNGSIKYFRF